MKDSSNVNETLRSGSKPSGNGGLKASGLKQGPTEKTTSDGGSNLETLRMGSKPGPEAVREASEDPGCRATAFNYWERESGDNVTAVPSEGARPGPHTQKVGGPNEGARKK